MCPLHQQDWETCESGSAKATLYSKQAFMRECEKHFLMSVAKKTDLRGAHIIKTKLWCENFSITALELAWSRLIILEKLLINLYSRKYNSLACPAGSLNARDQHSLWARLVACLAYAFMSISITLFNKAVFSVYNFPYPAFVTTLQITVSIVYMLALHYARFMDLGTSWSLSTARQVTSCPSQNKSMTHKKLLDVAYGIFVKGH